MNKLICALDVETAEEARIIIDELGDAVGAFKIGLQLFTAAGASFVREAVANGARIFLDLKFHDIPNTVARASVEAARTGVWMFNLHAVGGGEMMKKTVDVVRETCAKEKLEQPKIIAVTVLTSSNAATLRETGIEANVNLQVVNLARLSQKCGLDGVVASPLEIGAIRETIASRDFLIVTPGIRNGKAKAENRNEAARFETYDDQKRVTTAAEAVEAGADYLVVGRPILQARDRRAAARKIIEEISFQ